jgi:hypothetical protein
MPGITPNEGEALIASIIYNRILTDRDANLELGLFTNPTIDETTTHAALTEPSSGSYARKDLVDGNWQGTADQRTYAAQIFTASGSAMSGDIHGYFIATKAAGGTKRLLHIERDNLKAVTSITRSGSTATATVTAHGLSTGNKVNLQGAAQTEYNGVFTITVVDANTFTYTVTGTPATPATGTIDCNRVVNLAQNDTYTVNLSNVVA